MKTLIEETDKYKLSHHTGITRFTGCQCFGDCSCNEDFTPAKYDYYSVYKKVNKPKTTTHNTLEEARERINLINTLENTNNPRWIKSK